MESENRAILERAGYMAQRVHSYQVKSVVLMILYDLQIPLNYDGFGYLKHALVIAFQNPTQIVISEIFAAVGQKYIPEVDIRNMDAAIRDAVQKAWKNRNQAKWRLYLPDYMMERRNPPSNSELICVLVYFLELWQDCYEKEASYERV